MKVPKTTQVVIERTLKLLKRREWVHCIGCGQRLLREEANHQNCHFCASLAQVVVEAERDLGN